MSERIKPRHLGRRAVVYIRQSTHYQVMNNLESQRRQYAMQAKLREYGWKSVDVIDSDLGKSAAGSVERAGFESLLAAVCLGQVGAVAALELSRFARNSREWQQLIEICRVVDTLLIDEEAIYDARRTNDRLLLGLKGSLNEYELDVLRQRSQAAREQKARRGELGMNCPSGYVREGGGVFEKDPDLRVQGAIDSVFEQFPALGSARQVMLWMDSKGLQFPRRCWDGRVWRTVWKDVSYSAVLGTLKNPIYAGAYAWGRTEMVMTVNNGKLQRSYRKKPLQRWSVLEKDHHEGYIDWQTFERNLLMLSKNAQSYVTTEAGAAKGGASVLTGLLRCRRCGNKLHVRYGTGGQSKVLRYSCHVAYHTTGASKCIGFGGELLDRAVVAGLLEVIEPGLIDAVEAVVEEQRNGHDAALTALQLEVEAADYEVQRAQRYYNAVDPENRLVAGELEARWNAALQKAAETKERLEVQTQRTDDRAVPSREELVELIENFHMVWEAEHTDARLKKRLVRTVIEEIVVDIDEEKSEVVAVVHWKGGVHTEMRVARRRNGQSGLRIPTQIVDAVRSLSRMCSDASIAAWLTRSGTRTPSGKCWTRQDVTGLRCRNAIEVYNPERQRREGCMNLTQAAEFLGTDRTSLRRRINRGEVEAQRPLPLGPWILKRSDLTKHKRGALGADPTDSISGNVTLELFTTSSNGAV